MMELIKIVYKREINSYFDSAIAYIFAIAFLITTCGLYMNDFFLRGLVEMDTYFIPLPYLMIFFLPALSMRLWAEERRDNTYEFLMTIPVKPWDLVMGKFLASLAFFSITLAGSLIIVIMLIIFGSPEYGKIFGSYLGVLFLGSFYLALGEFLSAITKDQIVAYLITIMCTFIFYFSGNEFAVSIIDGLWPGLKLGSFIRENFSALPHYEAFLRGIIDLKDILYFSFLSGFFLWVNQYTIKKIR